MLSTSYVRFRIITLYLHLKLETAVRSTAYWIFDTNLLKSGQFNDYVYRFWEEWRQEKYRFADIGQWWDMGKIYLRSSVQQNFPKRQTGCGMFDRLNRLEKQLSNNPSLISQYIELKAKVKCATENCSLEHLAQEKSKSVKYGNSPTKFFFSNMRRRNKTTEIESIRNEDGRIITGMATNEPIRKHISKQFQDPEVDNAYNDEFFNGIPKLSEDSAIELDAPITEEELMESIVKLSRNTSPGLDG